MKRFLYLLTLSVLLAGCSCDGSSAYEMPIKKIPDEKVLLYPVGAPDDNGLEEGDDGLQPGYTQIGNKPTMSFFFPEHSNGQMVVMTPGGGYRGVYTLGGVIAANWFNERGIAVCLLEYRLPHGNPELPLEDVQTVFRYCRRYARSWGISQIGIAGGSAGGHLASLASVRFVDNDTRPDFTILLYPLITLVDSNDRETLECILGEGYSSDDAARYSTDRLVRKDAPPTFIACSADDLVVPYRNSEMFRDALIKNGVSVEYHMYRSGFHGWGFNSGKYCDLLNADNKGYYGLNDTSDVHYSDILEPWREDFEKSLASWLEKMRRSAPGLDLPDTSVVNAYVENFNAADEELYAESYPNDSAAAFLCANIPLFQCPDEEFVKSYYFRWWVFRKHLRHTDRGFVITEFMPDVFWAGPDNAISCPAAFHVSEARWLRDKSIASDYLRFWTLPDSGVRNYSFPLAHSLYSYWLVSRDDGIVQDMFDSVRSNYHSWEEEHRDSTGLFWQVDLRDGMECSISGKMSPDLSGYRPTINSYMYADARALARMASMLGREYDSRLFDAKADTLKVLMDSLLWNNDFYKVVPRHSDMSPCPARELLGYVPWIYGIPDADKIVAWEQLADSLGFRAEFGPTTAEQRAEGFAVNFPTDPYDYAAQWNGPSWPFATAQTLLGLASAIRSSEKNVFVDKSAYFDLFKTYSKCHRNTLDGSRTVCWIDENLDPYSGEWLLRRINQSRGHTDQAGKDYNHSGYADLLITGLMGIIPQDDGTILLNPLIPEGVWDYFCLTHVAVGGKSLSLIYDRTGRVYGKGKGFRAYVDGVEVFHSRNLNVKTIISI